MLKAPGFNSLTVPLSKTLVSTIDLHPYISAGPRPSLALELAPLGKVERIGGEKRKNLPPQELADILAVDLRWGRRCKLDPGLKERLLSTFQPNEDKNLL